MLLYVVTCCCARFETGQTFQPTTPTFLLFRDRRSVRNNVVSVCTALPTLLGSRTLITHGLLRLMGCILLTMLCRSQQCWELLRPFARSLRIQPQWNSPIHVPFWASWNKRRKVLKNAKFVLIVTYLQPPCYWFFYAPYIYERDTIILVLSKLLWSKEESIMIRWKNCLLYKTLRN